MSWDVAKLDADFSIYGQDWDRLNNTYFRGNLFYSSTFTGNLLRYYSEGNEYICIHRSANGQVDGMLILRQRRFGVWSSYIPSQAQIAPVLLQSSGCIHSLFSRLKGYVVLLECLNQDHNYSPDYSQYDEGGRIEQDHALTISIHIVRDFDSYWSSRSTKLRSNIKRYFKRLDSDNIGFRLEILESVEDIIQGIKNYGNLESKGWKGKAGTAIHYNNTQGKFYCNYLVDLAQTNNATIYELYFEDKLVASRLAAFDGNMLVMLKTTYDEEYSKYAPGRLLLYLVLRKEFEVQRASSVEFYTNATKDQITWSTGQRKISHVLLFRHKYIKKIYEYFLDNRKNNEDSATTEKSTLGVCEKYAGFGGLPESYYHLFNNAENNSFDLSYQWFVHFANTAIAADSSLYLYGVIDENRPVLFLPLYSNKNKILYSLSNYYSSIFMPLTIQTSETEYLVSVFKNIKEEKTWSTVDLSPLPIEDNSYKNMKIALSRSGWKVFSYFCFGNWYLPVPAGGYAEYRERLPSHLRNTLERKKKKFYKERNGHIELISNQNGIEKNISKYNQIYRSSWKKPEPFPNFIPGIIKMYASEGALRLGIAYIDDQPAAAQIWIVKNNKAAIYKLAYDKKYAAYSVGTLLTEYLINYVMEKDKVNELDYLTGDDSYKQDWMSHRRERWGLRAYNPATVRGMYGIFVEYCGRSIKKIMRIGVNRKEQKLNH